MSIFKHYARYYDLLYRDKDYTGEARYALELIRARDPAARTILNLGCGTGRHDHPMIDLGCAVTGVDLSAEMLELAEARAKGRKDLEYFLGDIRTVRLERCFDAVVSLFHVLSYQIANADLQRTFETARLHLAPGGILLFDCWYGPGVLTDPPKHIVREMEDEVIYVKRVTAPQMLPCENAVDIHFQTLITEKSSGAVEEIQETHRMRYLFLPEIELFLARSGFKLLDCHEFFRPLVKPALGTWNLTVLAEAASTMEGNLQ